MCDAAINATRVLTATKGDSEMTTLQATDARVRELLVTVLDNAAENYGEYPEDERNERAEELGYPDGAAMMADLTRLARALERDGQVVTTDDVATFVVDQALDMCGDGDDNLANDLCGDGTAAAARAELAGLERSSGGIVADEEA